MSEDTRMSAPVRPQAAVLVTGGSRGIGRAICLALADLGMPVYVNYARDEAAAHATCALVEEAGGLARPLQGAVDDPQAVQAMFERIRADGCWVHTLVNNAGFCGRSGLSSLARMVCRFVMPAFFAFSPM